MRINNLLYDAKAETTTTSFSGAGFIHAIETIEYMTQSAIRNLMPVSDTRSSICDFLFDSVQR